MDRRSAAHRVSNVESLHDNDEPGLAPDPDSVAGLYVRWKVTEGQLQSLLESQQSGVVRPMTGDTVPSDIQDSSEIANEQLEIVKGLSNRSSTSLADTVSKLKVWRDLIAPEGQEQDWLQPSDQLVLSILADLEAMARQS